MPTALSTLYCNRADVEAVLSAEGVTLRLDDDGSGTESVAETAYLTTQVLNWASAEINLYLLGKYRAAVLATSWKVNQIAAELAAAELCRRRGNPVPQSLAARVGSADKETGHYGVLLKLSRGELQFADIAQRVVDTPALSNVRVDPRYRVKQIRVQRHLGDQTPRTVAPAVDYDSEYVAEP